MFFPVLEGAVSTASKVLTTVIPAGTVDAILLDLRELDSEVHASNIRNFWAGAVVKIHYASDQGESKVIVDDVPAAFFIEYAKRRGGYTDVEDGVIVDLSRYNLTGNEELQVRVDFSGVAAADITALDGQLNCYRAYRLIDKEDGLHTTFRARPLQQGSGVKYRMTLDNLAEAYLLGADVSAVHLHIDGRVFDLDADILATLTHYESNAASATDLIQIYAASIIEQFSGDSVTVILDVAASGGYLVEIGSSPDLPAIVRSAEFIGRKIMTKIGKAEQVKPAEVQAAVSLGVLPAPHTISAAVENVKRIKPSVASM